MSLVGEIFDWFNRRQPRLQARRGSFRQRSDFSVRRAQPFNNRRFETQRRQRDHLENKIQVQNQILRHELSTERNDGRGRAVQTAQFQGRQSQRDFVQPREREENVRTVHVPRNDRVFVQTNNRRRVPVTSTQRSNNQGVRIVENARVVSPGSRAGNRIPVGRHFKPYRPEILNNVYVPEPDTRNAQLVPVYTQRRPETVVVRPKPDVNVNVAHAQRPNIVQQVQQAYIPQGAETREQSSGIVPQRTPLVQPTAAGLSSVNAINGGVQILSQQTMDDGSSMIHILPSAPSVAPSAQSIVPVSILGKHVQNAVDLSGSVSVASAATNVAPASVVNALPTNIIHHANVAATNMANAVSANTVQFANAVPTNSVQLTNVAPVPVNTLHQANPFQSLIERMLLGGESTDSPDVPDPTVITTTVDKLAQLLTSQIIEPTKASMIGEQENEEIEWEDLPPTTTTTTTTTTTPRPTTTTTTTVKPTTAASTMIKSIAERIVSLLLEKSAVPTNVEAPSPTKNTLPPEIAKLPMTKLTVKPTLSTRSSNPNTLSAKTEKDTIIIVKNGHGKNARAIAIPKRALINVLKSRRTKLRRKGQADSTKVNKETVSESLSKTQTGLNLDGVRLSDSLTGGNEVAMSPYVAGNDLGGFSVEKIRKLETNSNSPSVDTSDATAKSAAKKVLQKLDTGFDNRAVKRVEKVPTKSSNNSPPTSESVHQSSSYTKTVPVAKPTSEAKNAEPSAAEILSSLRKLIESQQTTQPPTTPKPTTTTMKTTILTTTAAPKEECTPRSPNFQCRGKDLFAIMDSISAWCVGMCVSKGCINSVCKCGCDVMPTQQSPTSAATMDFLRQQQMLYGWGTTNKPVTTEEPPEADEYEAEDGTTTQTPPSRPWWALPFPNSPSPSKDFTLAPLDPSKTKSTQDHLQHMKEIAWASELKSRLKNLAVAATTSTTPAPGKQPPDWSGTPWHLPPLPMPPKPTPNGGPPALSELFSMGTPNLRNVWGRSNSWGGNSESSSGNQGMFWGNGQNPWGGGGGMDNRFSRLRFSWGGSSSGGGEENEAADK
ncbi:hypothetical protein ACF0H5_024525 [Mactra antiquata]